MSTNISWYLYLRGLVLTGFDWFSSNISHVWGVLKTKTPKTPKT